MNTFKAFLEQKNFVEFLINEFDNHQISSDISQEPPENLEIDTQPFLPTQTKPFSAKKKEVLRMWRSLRPNLPIYIEPISPKDSSTYGKDGIRLSGSKNFIAGVLSRLKEILIYENPKTRLNLIFRGTQPKKDIQPNAQSYVFYINVQQRGS
jgi:hypothetical protein